MNLCVVQARMGSHRFPGKSLELLAGRPLIFWSLTNALRIPGVDKVVLATTRLAEDDRLAEFANNLGVEVIRGDSLNVLSRFVAASRLFKAHNLVRMTGDNPLTPIDLASQTIAAHLEHRPHYTSTILSGSFPKGSDIECFTSSALETLALKELTKAELEHVTLGFRNRPFEFRLLSPVQANNLSSISLTVDTNEDMEHMRRLFAGAQQGWQNKLSEIVATYERVFDQNNGLLSGPSPIKSQDGPRHKR